MTQTMTLSPADSLADLCRSLRPDSQTTLLQFALFLKTSDTAAAAIENVDEAEEAAWDRDFSDPRKMTAFTRWAEKALSEGPDEPLDLSRL